MTGRLHTLLLDRGSATQGLCRRLATAFVALAWLLVFLPKFANGDVPETVQQLYEACKRPISSSDRLECIVYIAGVADVMQFLAPIKDEDPVPFAICNTGSYGAMVQAFVNWAEKNPKEWGMARLYGVMMALRLNWPCPAK